MTTTVFNAKATQAGLEAAARAQAENRVLQITHIAVGVGQYVPTGLETALQTERDRAVISRRTHVSGSIYEVAATITGSQDYFANEVGFLRTTMAPRSSFLSIRMRRARLQA